MFTLDLVVEGDCGIRHALPTSTVQNSARHGEAHHTEDRLHTEPQKQLHIPTCGCDTLE